MKRLARGKGPTALSELNIHKKRKTAISRLERDRESIFQKADADLPRGMPKSMEQCLKFAQEARASGNSGVLNRIPGNIKIQYKA